MILVGTTARLKVPLLANPARTFGVCYSVDYSLGRPSYGFIFENSNYDGFSPDEVEQFLEIAGFDRSVENYQFTNVMKLSEDFEHGVFNAALLRRRDAGQ